MAAKSRQLWQLAAALLPLLASPLLASIPRTSELASACSHWGSKPHVRASESADGEQPQAFHVLRCEIASGDFVSSYDYNYDKNGNRTQQTEQNGASPETTTYEYDDADRLTKVSYPDKTVDYTLDGVGNRTNEVTTDTTTSTVTSSKLFTYNERDWLVSIADSADATNDATYSYDLNGNQVARTQGSVATGFIYDTRDQLVEVQNDGTLVETYDFSFDGLRTRKSGSGSLFRYVYDGKSLLLETDLAGNTISKYEWGSDRLLSLNHATEGRSFYLFDALGSPVSLSKPDGTLQARYLWDAWGNLRSEVGASSSIFGFTGYQRDEATGLLYGLGRMYDPATGRWLTEDPAGNLDSTNPFQYGLLNPLRFRDPMGMAVGDWWDVRSYADFNPASREGSERTVKFLKGEINGAVAAAKTTVNAALHPIQTVNAAIETTAELTVNADRVLPALPSALKDAAQQWVAADPEKQGEAVGEILYAVATGAAGAKAGAAATKKVASLLARNVDDVARAGLPTLAGAADEIADVGRATRLTDEVAESIPTRGRYARVGEGANGDIVTDGLGVTRSAPATISTDFAGTGVRARVLGNIAESAAARAASNFPSLARADEKLLEITARAARITDRLLEQGSTHWARVYSNPALGGAKVAAIAAKRPSLFQSVIRGNIMDDVAKQLAAKVEIPFLEITPRGRWGPDFRVKFLDTAWDVTTPRSFPGHVIRYADEPFDLRPLVY